MNSWIQLFREKVKQNIKKERPPETFLAGAKEKVAKIEFYAHDLRIGNPNPTVYEVATASITAESPTEIGSVHVVDDLITAAPEINSKPVGRIQGLTTSADLSVRSVAVNLTVVFSTGQFSGSTICILGRNKVMEERRELAVAGGTGAFRFARGYAIQSTTSYDAAASYGVFKYTIYTTYGTEFSETHDVEVVEL